jgi:hypothetical protein
LALASVSHLASLPDFRLFLSNHNLSAYHHTTSLVVFCIAEMDVHQRIGAVFIKFSAKAVIGLMTVAIGHSPLVSDRLINSRIKKMVKKKSMRSANMDLLVPEISLKRLSLIVKLLTSCIAIVAELELGGTDILTPLSSIVD